MRQRFCKALRSVDAVPIENKLAKGTPDVEFIGGWAELKWLPRWKKNSETSPVLIPHYTKEQRLWARRRYRRGGISLLVLQVGKEWMIFEPPFSVDQIGRTATRPDLIKNAIQYWPNGLNNWELLQWIKSLS